MYAHASEINYGTISRTGKMNTTTQLARREGGVLWRALLFLVALSSGAAADTPSLKDFLVELQNGVPADLTTVFAYSKHDLPGLRGPAAGYQVSHSALWPGNPSYTLQTFTFSAFDALDPARGDGGQLVYYDGRLATGVETRDGGSPANQYFAPAGCGVDGWIFFMPAYVPRGSWSSTKAKLVDVPEPTGNCPSPATAFTQWRIELASMYFLLSGVPNLAAGVDHHLGALRWPIDRRKHEHGAVLFRLRLRLDQMGRVDDQHRDPAGHRSSRALPRCVYRRRPVAGC